MRILLSYIILICLALSNLTGSVALANSALPALQTESSLQHSVTATPTPSCHSMQPATSLEKNQAHTDNHDCCNQQDANCGHSICDNGCCAQHCAVAHALLNTSLFNYIPVLTASNEHLLTLPDWLFFKDPPPPINV